LLALVLHAFLTRLLIFLFRYTNNYYNTLNHNGLLPSQIEVRTMKIGIESFLSSAAAANDKVYFMIIVVTKF